MPVTRSTKPTGPASNSRREIPPDDEIIIISSDDEPFLRPALLRKNGRSSKNKQGKEKEHNAGGTSHHVLLENGNFCYQYDAAAFKELNEKLRITQADLNSIRSALDVERTTRTDMKEKNDQLKKHVQSLKTELSTLKEKLDQSNADNKENKMLRELEERILCEICQDKLWSPFVLECGHTACQDCLVDWFETTRRCHQIPSCPKCRALVGRKPAENFAVKEFVQLIAHTADPAITSPPKRPSPFHKFFGH